MGMDSSGNVKVANDEAVHVEVWIPLHNTIPRWNTQPMLHDVVGECLLRREEGAKK